MWRVRVMFTRPRLPQQPDTFSLVQRFFGDFVPLETTTMSQPAMFVSVISQFGLPLQFLIKVFSVKFHENPSSGSRGD